MLSCPILHADMTLSANLANFLTIFASKFSVNFVCISKVLAIKGESQTGRPILGSIRNKIGWHHMNFSPSCSSDITNMNCLKFSFSFTSFCLLKLKVYNFQPQGYGYLVFCLLCYRLWLVIFVEFRHILRMKEQSPSWELIQLLRHSKQTSKAIYSL